MSGPKVRTEDTPAPGEPADVVSLDVAPGDVTEAAAVPPDAPPPDVLPVQLATGTGAEAKTEDLFAHLWR